MEADSAGAPFALELVDVRCSFGSLIALKDIRMSIRPGERRAVLGANGAGKTTLFNVISGDFPPTAGRILLFGDDITNRPVHDRIRRGLRRTYQQSQLFDRLSVRDHLYLAVRGVSQSDGGSRFKIPRACDAVMQRAYELAELVGLQHCSDSVAGELSHGQRRQLEIGMAMAGSARVLLLDEPAAGLSPAERVQLVEMLIGLPQRMTIVIIEHDLDIAMRVADWVTIMDNGAVFREGSPAQIRTDNEVQSLYLGATRA